MKQIAITAGLVIVGMVAVIFGQPILTAYSAERQFKAASYYGFSEKCDIATRAKNAWASTPFAAKYAEWDQTAESYCRIR
jgi:hypothetical protein